MTTTTAGHLATSRSDVHRHQMLTLQVSRNDFLDGVMEEGRHLYEHPHRATRDIRLQPMRRRKSSSWSADQKSSDAYARYIVHLDELERTVREAERKPDLPALNHAMTSLIQAVNSLGILGWRVNWEQNAQWAFGGSSYGMSGYAAVPRYDGSSDRITLVERLEILGTLTFLTQWRKGDKLRSPEQVILSRTAEDAYGAVMLSLTGTGRRYASDWIDDIEKGMSFRLLSD